MRYNDLFAPIVKSIQELKAENDKIKVESEKLRVACLTERQENIELKNENERLSSDVELLKSMNEKIVKLEQIVNELTSNKHTSLIESKVNMTNSKQGDEK